MIFIKLGGSIITHKDKPFSVNWGNLGILSNELRGIEERMIVGHGGGSFGHFVAKEYKGRPEGFPKIREAMDKLNQMVVSSLISKDIPAIGFHPSSFMIARGGKLEESWFQSLLEVSKQFVPVIHGAAIPDKEDAYTIFSTERIFKGLVPHFRPKKVLIASDSPVIIDDEPVKEIADWNFRDIFSQIKESENVDVTGGMRGKVLEAAEISAKGVEVYIFDGGKKGAIKRAWKYGEGTRIRVSSVPNHFS